MAHVVSTRQSRMYGLTVGRADSPEAELLAVTAKQIATVGAGVTSYTNTGLKADRTYWYRVRAYNTAGASAYSNTASATTPRR